LQSDVEALETDAEENVFLSNTDQPNPEQINLDYSDRPDLLEDVDHLIHNVPQHDTHNESNSICFVSGNSNLMVNHFNDNFPQLTTSLQQNIMISSNINEAMTGLSLQHDKETKRKINELEKRKLSQNIDNFSVRLGSSVESAKQQKGDTLKKSVWNSSDETHSSPIENEEWLAFLHKSMQEILDGELDSLGQHNFVSIIVAPLRNAKTSAKVIECIAQLLSLPLIMELPANLMEDIKKVYLEIKIIPNLIYSSKLICVSHPKLDSSEQLTTPSPQMSPLGYRSVLLMFFFEF
jgi:fused